MLAIFCQAVLLLWTEQISNYQ